ncbi:MAG: polyisoprenoid-binding protein [Sphingobium sp.]|nr:polyisoprenoid-binding protein [Sphingobium sp.]
MRLPLIALAVATIGLSAGVAINAQNAPSALPGQADASRITGGTYAVDGGHTQVLFSYDHMGFSKNMGVIAEPTGSLTLDPKSPAKAKVSVTFPIANIRTGISALDEHLTGADFFDAAQFPQASFTSTAVTLDPKDKTKAKIAGTLTIKGVSKPVVLDASFYGAGTNPMSKKETVGFSAKTSINRSEFNAGAYVPAVGDKVDLKITAAFEK